ncbi:alpha/beta hydrolase [Actinomadura craniellae]|nr:alpha/beta hydrolase [Actinomadura craniellae]
MVASCTDSAQAPGQKSIPPGLGAFYNQQVAWAGCGDGFECAHVEVPLDYAAPSKSRLKLAVIRMRARGSDRIGSLLINPGGPGGSGVDWVRGAAQGFNDRLRERFDIVGFDPRGVGKSNPVHCLDGEQLDTFFATDATPDSQDEIDDLADVGRGFADGCKERSGSVLPHVGTQDAARDMDVLRAALGDEKLTYMGLSYGTYLGAYYAERFPRQVRALVLDGAVDPTLSATDVLQHQAKGFEEALRSFAADCVTQSGCPLGRTVDGALNRIAALQKRADGKPLRNTSGDGRKVQESLVTSGIAQALYTKQLWPALRAALATALTGDGTALLRLADQMVERRPDGSYGNLMEANMAINCVDKPHPADVPAFKKEVAKAEKASSRFGAFVVWGGLPCVHWPVKPAAEPAPPTAAGAPPIVVIGTTRDPATPYAWSRALAGQLTSGRLVTLDGDGHTAYFQANACITQAVDAYLVNGTPPADGTTCR